jgi:porphobilinogen synthase
MNAPFPLSLRRLRDTPLIRDLVAEHRVDVRQLIQPLFVVENLPEREAVAGLRGTFRDTPASLLTQIERDIQAGIRKFLLFPVPAQKHHHHFSADFAVQQIAAIKQRFGHDIWLAVDVCLCSATTHGQCGILNETGEHLHNHATVTELASQALAFAQAGADCVAPSDMMDGRIAAIRALLDANGCERVTLMSYSAKFHSRFYGPFRNAADSAPKGEVALRDRATYQIDPPNYQDALRSSLRDAEEGADILMVKPAMPYLDVVYRLSQAIPLPWAVYQVSGEYAAIEALATQGLMDAKAAHLEAWTGFIRAGASMIITYGARYGKEWLEDAE